MARDVKATPTKRILDGTVQAIRHLRAPVKDYLLARIGLSAHDIRVFGPAQAMLKLSSTYSNATGFEYPWWRKVEPEPLQILNVSNTSPALLACHLLVDWLDAGHDFVALSARPQESTQGHIWSEDYLSPGLAEGTTSHEVPVLRKGLVQTLRFRPLQFIYHVEVEQWAARNGAHVGDEIIGEVPEPLSTRVTRALSESTSHARVQLLIILDNEEALPFLWDNRKKRFLPGFNSLGLVTS